MSGLNFVAVVLHFRTPKISIACLESLRLAGIQRVVLVDNSQDEGVSLRAMSDALLRLRAAGLVIDIEQPARNLGFAAGVNLGIARAQARQPTRILLLNSDATIDAVSLGALSKALDAGHALAAPRIGANPQTADCEHAYHRWTGLLVRPSQPGSVRFLSGACLLIAEHIATPQLFDETFFFYWEDVALSARLQRQGLTITCVPTAFAYHAASGSAKNGSWFYEYNIVRGHWLLASCLTQNSVSFVLALFGRIIYLPLRAVVRCARSRSLRPLFAFLVASWDVLRHVRRDVTPAAMPSSKK